MTYFFKSEKFINYFYILVTFIVAFCSIVYELLFAQVLTTVFGATVLQYSLTIGVFMFFLGVGAFVVEYFFINKVKEYSQKSFVVVEAFITIFAILGLLFIFELSTLIGRYSQVVDLLLQIFAYFPVAIIGFLSGAELPLLVKLYSNRHFAQVLGIDYFGSLFGTIIYALLLYPKLGLIMTMVVIALVNAFVAVLFAFVHFTKRKVVITVIFLMLVFLTSFYFTTANKINNYFESIYYGVIIKNVYAEYGVNDTAIRVTDVVNTPYQTALEYDIVFNVSRGGNIDHCLNLDRHIQACGNWVKSYHNGLVNVPMSFFKKGGLDVLILGGGDFIPANFLRKFDDKLESIDIVDIDKKFQNYAKRSKFLLTLNEKSFLYKKVNVIVSDALFYLRHNKKQYDLILIDLPGIKHDKLLPLYSKEFFSFIKSSLKNYGFAVSWFYPEKMYPVHASVLNETLRSAGFTKRLNYVAYNPIGKNVQETEWFFVLPKMSDSLPLINTVPNSYTKRFALMYKKAKWQDIKKTNVRPNSILKPNYDIIIKKPVTHKL